MPDCSICSKSYARAEHLKRHVEVSHRALYKDKNGGPRQFACDADGCGRVFTRSDVLLRHRRGHVKNASSDERQSVLLRGSSSSSEAGVGKVAPMDSDIGALKSDEQLQSYDASPRVTKRKAMDLNHTASTSSPSSSTSPFQSRSRSKTHQAHHSIHDGLDRFADHASGSRTHPDPQSHMLDARMRSMSGPGPMVGADGTMAPLHTSALHNTTEADGSAADRSLPQGPGPSYVAQPQPNPATGNTPSNIQYQPSHLLSDLVFGLEPEQPHVNQFAAGEPVADSASVWGSAYNLGGLDWIFDEHFDAQSMTETSSISNNMLPSSSAFEEHRAGDWQVFGPSPPVGLDRNADMLGISGRGHGSSTEALNLLNLANAAVAHHGSEGPPQASGNNFTQNGRTNEDDGGDSWPQDYRPARAKPPTIEISRHCLHIEESHHADDLEAWLAAAAAPNQTPTSQSQGSSTREVPLVIIDESGEATRANSRRASVAPPGPSSSLFFSSHGVKWRVTDATRQQLLSYLEHACRHPWSIYSFTSSPTPSFLTCQEMEKLISLYFRKFAPYVPLLHPSTFDPATSPPVLLLIVMAVGLVFYSSEVEKFTAYQGKRNDSRAGLTELRKNTNILALAFSELTRIGVMSAFEADQRGFQNIAINQAWVIQQIFGIQSGNKRLFKIAERNRGGLITAIRRIGLLQTAELSQDLSKMNDNQLDKAWRSWIDRETRVRLGWFVYLYDQMFCCYMDISPNLHYTEMSSSFPSDERLWNCADAGQWRSKTPSRSPEHDQQQKSTLASTDGHTAFLTALRRVMYPGHETQSRHLDTKATPLRLNRLEAYILAVTLYRLRWDASKQSILLQLDENAPLNAGASGERSQGNSLDTVAARALEGLSTAASRATSVIKARAPPPSGGDSSINLALSIDVQLLLLLSKLHFLGPSVFFDKIRDAVGGGDSQSEKKRLALSWLEQWLSNSHNRRAKREMLLASASIFNLMRSSLNTTQTEPDVLVLQSNICIFGLFHAALTMWAIVKFSSTSELKESKRSWPGQDAFRRDAGTTWFGLDAESSASSSTSLPRLDPSQVLAIQASGVLDLVVSPGERYLDDSLDANDHWEKGQVEWEDEHKLLTQAWVCGAYVSSADEQIYYWEESSTLKLHVPGIGELPAEQRGRAANDDGMAAEHNTPATDASFTAHSSVQSSVRFAPSPYRNNNADDMTKPRLVLTRFASLFRRLDWGLAAAFRNILVAIAGKEDRVTASLQRSFATIPNSATASS